MYAILFLIASLSFLKMAPECVALPASNQLLHSAIQQQPGALTRNACSKLRLLRIGLSALNLGTSAQFYSKRIYTYSSTDAARLLSERFVFRKLKRTATTQYAQSTQTAPLKMAEFKINLSKFRLQWLMLKRLKNLKDELKALRAKHVLWHRFIHALWGSFSFTPSFLKKVGQLVICAEKDSEKEEVFNAEQKHTIGLTIHLADLQSELLNPDHDKALKISSSSSNIAFDPAPPLLADASGIFSVSVSREAGSETLTFSVTDESLDPVSITLKFLQSPTSAFLCAPKGAPANKNSSIHPFSPLLIPGVILLTPPDGQPLANFKFESERSLDLEVRGNGELFLHSGRCRKIYARSLNASVEIDLFKGKLPQQVLTFQTEVGLTRQGLEATLAAFPTGTSLPTTAQMQSAYQLWGSFKAYALSLQDIKEENAWFWTRKDDATAAYQLFNGYSGEVKELDNAEEYYFAAFLMAPEEHALFFEQGIHHRPLSTSS